MGNYNGGRILFAEPRNGIGARPNVYRRSLEARQTTNAYLAEVERRAAGLDEPPTKGQVMKVWHLALIVLGVIALCVGLWVL